MQGNVENWRTGGPGDDLAAANVGDNPTRDGKVEKLKIPLMPFLFKGFFCAHYLFQGAKRA